MASVTFIALTEAHVLNALRRAGVRPNRIRPAVRRFHQEFGEEDIHVVAEEFGVSVADVRTAARVLLGRAA